MPSDSEISASTNSAVGTSSSNALRVGLVGADDARELLALLGVEDADDAVERRVVTSHIWSSEPLGGVADAGVAWRDLPE